ncbi:MAG: TetR/AcrR family transcriptional regulator [bacterium]
MQTRRERVRQAAIDEIKSIAWDIATAQGIEDVTVNGIARQMGMTPPAFYSYFKNRDELIKSLVIDAYRSFRQALAEARDSVPAADSARRLYDVLIAYRHWAIANPALFGLFAGRRVHGFDTREPEIIEAAENVYSIFSGLYNDAWQRGILKPPKTSLDIPPAYAVQIREIARKRYLEASIETINLILHGGSLIHGMISMELSGRLSDLVGDPFLFYQFQVLDLLKKFGIDYHPDSKPKPQPQRREDDLA